MPNTTISLSEADPTTKRFKGMIDKPRDLSAGGSGDVVGPSSSTDNAIARFDGTTGKLLQDSSVTIDDTGNVTIGNGAAGVDYALTFDGETNDGSLTWMEDEAHFRFDDGDVKIGQDDNNEKYLRFGDLSGQVFLRYSPLSNIFTFDAKVLFPSNGIQIGSAGDIQQSSASIRLTPDVIAAGHFTVGSGAAGVDYTLTFDGETSNGTITYMEDEAEFRFDQAVSITSGDLTVDTNTLKVDSTNERVGINTASPDSLLEILQEGTAAERAIRFSKVGDDVVESTAQFQKSRGTEASPTALVNGDRIGWFRVRGYDGSAFQTSAGFGFDVDGAVSVGTVPISMIFRTGTASFGTDRMRINSSGDVLLGTSTSPSGTAGKTLMFGDNAGDPTPGSNTAGVYAKDVSGTVEMFAVDEAGNVTQLSPHDPKTGNWIHNSVNLRTGRRTYIDMERAIEVLERISGERLIERTFEGIAP